MSVGTSELRLKQLDSDGMRAIKDELLEVYAEVYSEKLGDPFFSVARFWERLEAYADRDGFSLIIAQLGDRIVGFTLGYTLPAGSRWWKGFRGDSPPDALVEDGRRTFAVNELMVLSAFRRRGYAHALHDALIAHRPESRATLLVRPDNIPARSAYLSWGWYVFGELQPFDDSPVYESLVRDLVPQSAELG